MTDDQVVIVDAKGTRHVFPAGMDPKKAAEIVRAQGDGRQSMLAPDLGRNQAGRMDTFGEAPIDNATGKPGKVKAPKPPRGVMAPLLALASGILTRGASLPESIAAGAFGGGMGNMAEAKLRGEPIEPVSVLEDMTTQGAISGAGPVVKLGGKGFEAAGNLLSKFTAGKGTQAVAGLGGYAATSALPSYARVGVGAAAAKAAPPVIERGVQLGGRVARGVGEGLQEASAAESGMSVGAKAARPGQVRVVQNMPGYDKILRNPGAPDASIEAVVGGTRAAMVPQSIRKMQMLANTLRGFGAQDRSTAAPDAHAELHKVGDIVIHNGVSRRVEEVSPDGQQLRLGAIVK